MNDGDTIESRNRLSTIADASSASNRHFLAPPTVTVSEQLLRALLAEDLGGVQKLRDVFFKGSASLEEGLEVIPMAISTVWEALGWERITGVYAGLEGRATNGIDSAHLSKKSGMITLTSSWDEIMSAPWRVWGQKPKMS